jgi:hypothetical protein
VWLGGRPARVSAARALAVFLQPWRVTAPVAAALVAAWLGCRALMTQTVADLLAIALLGPVAVAAAIDLAALSRSLAGGLAVRPDVRVTAGQHHHAATSPPPKTKSPIDTSPSHSSATTR